MRKKRCWTTCTQIAFLKWQVHAGTVFCIKKKQKRGRLLSICLCCCHSFRTEIPSFTFLFESDNLSSSRARISIVWAETQVAADSMPVHQMNRCTQQSANDTTPFRQRRGRQWNWKKDIGVSYFWKGKALETVKSSIAVNEYFYATQLVWHLEAEAPQVFMRMNAPFFFFPPAKALCVMTICLFEYENAEPWHAAGGKRWEQLFKLRNRVAAIDGKAPFPV